jgi:hypothetical protein
MKSWKEAFEEWYEKYFPNEWDKFGFTDEEAEKWANVGAEPMEAYRWRSAGFDIPDFIAWCELDVGLEHAKAFRERGLSPDDIKQWVEKVDLKDYSDIIFWVDLGLTIDEVKELQRKGYSLDSILELVKSGESEKLESIMKGP